MKVALIQVDGKWPNLALMKLGSFHKKRGDEVTLIDISSQDFDRIYASKIFVGGSGVDLKSELPEEIELQVPDYELFKTDHSIGFTSRGCIRDCGFCIVKEKEGWIEEAPFDWVISDKVLVFDNNFLASPKWKEKLEYFIRQRLKVCFTQGLDIRLITEENAKLLNRVRYYDNKFRRRRLYFSFDDPALETVVKEKTQILFNHGILPQHLMFYVLIGYNTTFEEDMHRFEVLNELGVLPFIMPFNGVKKNQKQTDFVRWINQRFYKVVPFEKYDCHYRANHKKNDSTQKSRAKTPRCSTLCRTQNAQKKDNIIRVRLNDSLRQKAQEKANRFCKGNLSLFIRHCILKELK